MRKIMLVITIAGFAVLGATVAAGAADYPVTSGGLEVSQGGSSTTAVSPGSSVTVAGSGFAPGASVQVTIASTPTLLATVNADAAGAMSAEVTIPSDIEAGTHTLSASGADPNGGTRVLSRTISVSGSTSGSDSSGAAVFGRTGANSAALAGVGLAVVALGWLFVVVTRRRSNASTPGA